MKLRECVQWFAEHMENKLTRNDSRGGWDHCTDAYLFGRLNEEIAELRRAMKRLKKCRDNEFSLPFAANEVAEEAADVGNFAMMIADKARRTAVRSR